MATTSTQSLLDQLLDKFESWMIQAEFGCAIAQLPASSQPSVQALDK